MADVEFENSDFAEAILHLQKAGDTAADGFCPAFGVLGSPVVESALGDADAIIRHAMGALAGVGRQARQRHPEAPASWASSARSSVWTVSTSTDRSWPTPASALIA